MSKMIVCIICPKGCNIKVEGEENRIDSITNHQCKRGYEYAQKEFISPCRILTTAVRMTGSNRQRLPVRTSKAIPKHLLMPCMAEIKKLSITGPVQFHEIILQDILGTGADLIACMPTDQEDRNV